ncbi:MAG: hypothetical protein ABI843_14755, partial [Dokdonella sp.]
HNPRYRGGRPLGIKPFCLGAMKRYEQSDLVNDLVRIFPEFSTYWEEDNAGGEFRSSGLHSVYMSFLPFLASVQPTKGQWQFLADHLSNAVASGGDWENAADTCVLEHLHQVKLNKILRPLLSTEARACVRA